MAHIGTALANWWRETVSDAVHFRRQPTSAEALAVCSVGASTPSYAKPGDAGADLSAAEAVTVAAGGTVSVGTGLRLALPSNMVGLVHPRSGLAAKHGVTVLNAPGTIDSGYRGEVRVLLHNTSGEDFAVQPGDRIAQLVVQRYERVRFVTVSSLPVSARGSSGFGSTGVSNG